MPLSSVPLKFTKQAKIIKKCIVSSVIDAEKKRKILYRETWNMLKRATSKSKMGENGIAHKVM